MFPSVKRRDFLACLIAWITSLGIIDSVCAYDTVLSNNFSGMEGQNSIMSNFINCAFVLFGIDLNQLITAWILRHWLHFVWLVIDLFIFSSSPLETNPISLFAGLINRDGNLVLKFSLWSFNIKYADWSVYCSILFSSFSFLAKCFVSLSIFFLVDVVVFCYPVVTKSVLTTQCHIYILICVYILSVFIPFGPIFYSICYMKSKNLSSKSISYILANSATHPWLT